MRKLIKKFKANLLAKKYLTSIVCGSIFSGEIHQMTIIEAQKEVADGMFHGNLSFAKKMPLRDLAFNYVALSTGGTEIYDMETGKTEYIGYTS